jgi:hypothetical protein
MDDMSRGCECQVQYTPQPLAAIWCAGLHKNTLGLSVQMVPKAFG